MTVLMISFGIDITSAAELKTKEFMAYDQVWSYNDQGKDLGKDWLKDSFNYSSWKKGKAAFGFGDDFSEVDPSIPIGTVVGFGPDEANKIMTTYFKTEIDVKGLSDYKNLQIYIHVDDGAAVYFNGKEAFRRGIDDGIEVKFDTSAKFKPKHETFLIPANLLKEGKNIISAEVHQDGKDSSDLWFAMSIKGTNAEIIEESTSDKKDLGAVADPSVPKGEVSRVTVTVKGDTKTSRGFTWYTTHASVNSDLHVVEKSKGTDFTNAIKFRGTIEQSTNAPDFVVHKADAIGLKPGTEYIYRVGDQKIDLWSETGSFKTAGLDGKFTFINLADSQAKTEEEAILAGETFELALKTVPNAEFISINGDIVDVGLNEEQWGWVLDNSKEAIMNTTFVAAAGNHDEDSESFIEHFNLETPAYGSTKTGAYYSYDYNNVHFIVLNNNEDSTEYRNFTPEQIEWLKQDVTISRKNKNIDWVIVLMHKGPYTTSNHATDADIMDPNGVRTLVAPLFNQLGVDIVLQGHDHIYARSKPIKDGKATVPATVKGQHEGQTINYSKNPDGTIYLIPNTTGPKVYFKNTKIDSSYYSLFDYAEEHSAAKYAKLPEDASRPPRSIIQNFVGITVEGDKLSAIVYEVDRNVDANKIYVIDTFGIIKSK